MKEMSSFVGGLFGAVVAVFACVIGLLYVGWRLVVRLRCRARCIFCDIIAGKVTADIVHRDERVVVFRDISPSARVHLLVVPVEHRFTDVSRVDDIELLRHMKRVGIDCGQRFEQSCEESGGWKQIFMKPGWNSVWHLHLHTIGQRDRKPPFLSWLPHGFVLETVDAAIERIGGGKKQ